MATMTNSRLKALIKPFWNVATSRKPGKKRSKMPLIDKPREKKIAANRVLP